MRAGSVPIRQVRAQYLQDWLHDPDAPMTWRLDKYASPGPARSATSAPTCVDTAQWVTGQSDHRRLRDHGDVRDVTAR